MKASHHARPSAYPANGAWSAAQPLLPPRYRTATDSVSTPAESWWPWRDMRVHLDRYGPVDASARLLVLHGAGGNGRLMAPLAVAAARAGFAAVCPDLPGFGLTQVRDRAELRYRDWVDCATDLLREEATRGPVVVAGLSVGGMLAYDAAARAGAAGLVVTCLLDVRREHVRRGIARWPVMSAAADRLWPYLQRADRIPVPLRWVSKMTAIANDPALARRIATDPLAGGTIMPLGWLRTFLQSVPALEPERFTICPVVLAHPVEDPWTPIELSLPFVDRIPPAHRQVELLDGAGHFPIEQPGLDRLVDLTVEKLQAAATSAADTPIDPV